MKKEKISMKAIKSVTPLIVLLLILSGIAYGQQSSPPPEAYKACEGKSAGSAAQLVDPSGETVSGTCEEKNGKLFLRLDRTIGNSGGSSVSPPPEAYKACEGKSAGSAVQSVGPSGETVSGTCEEKNGRLFLRPDRTKADN